MHQRSWHGAETRESSGDICSHPGTALVYEGSGEERRDREERKSAARGGGGQGLIGRVTSTLAPNEGYALTFFPREPALHRQLVLRTVLGRRADAERRGAGRRPLRGRLRRAARLRLAPARGDERRLRLLLADAVPSLRPLDAQQRERDGCARVGKRRLHRVRAAAARAAPLPRQWRRENPTTAGRAYTILEAAGRGHFVGAALFMQNRRPGVRTFFGPFGFLEGDEMIFVDGETTPSIVGTGTEDYSAEGSTSRARRSSRPTTACSSRTRRSRA